MISQTAEYALRAVVCLASQPDVALTTQQIAVTTRVPPSYLSKVLQSLGRASIIHSQRGLHGGFTLARPLEALTVLEVVNAVDPLQRIRTCPLKLESHGTNLCPLHRRLDEAMAQVERSFAETTIAELMAELTTSKPLCDMRIPALEV
jgi:Rrf2 family protein